MVWFLHFNIIYIYMPLFVFLWLCKLLALCVCSVGTFLFTFFPYYPSLQPVIQHYPLSLVIFFFGLRFLLFNLDFQLSSDANININIKFDTKKIKILYLIFTIWYNFRWIFRRSREDRHFSSEYEFLRIEKLKGNEDKEIES